MDNTQQITKMRSVRKVMETGIAHKNPGAGMVGAGILSAPEQCFRDAFTALQEI